MSTVINPKEEEIHRLSSEEASDYFEQMVREFFGVSTAEFLKDQKKFETNPHFASVEFLIPLIDGEK